MRAAFCSWLSGLRSARSARYELGRSRAVSALILSMLAASANSAVVAAAVFPGALRNRSLPRGPDRVRVLHEVMVRMSDGVRLATDIYLPKRSGTWPAILVRTPYGKASEASRGEFFASHGYAYVVQDVRGLFDSEGTFNPYANDPEDGRQTAQ